MGFLRIDEYRRECARLGSYWPGELLSGVLIHCLNTQRNFTSGLEYKRCLFPGSSLAGFGQGLPWGRDCPMLLSDLGKAKGAYV